MAVNKLTRTVTYIISSGEEVIGTGTYTVGDDVSLNVQGMEVELGRALSYAYFDNISIYATDKYTYDFTEYGTLTVTSTYEGCTPSTATYIFEPAPPVTIIPGDANGDGDVNIVDVTITISRILGQATEGCG